MANVLIVNADDFGYSKGVNEGIIKAHTDGIVTSTSVMVDGVAANEAVVLTSYPKLSVGLHYVVADKNTEADLERQINKFKKITGTLPSHLDIHKQTDDEHLRSVLGKYAKENDIVFRYSGAHVFINSFIATPDNPDVSISRLASSLSEAKGKVNELMCHVGYADEFIMQNSSYNSAREEELKTICSTEARELVRTLGFVLGGWSDTKH